MNKSNKKLSKGFSEIINKPLLLLTLTGMLFGAVVSLFVTNSLPKMALMLGGVIGIIFHEILINKLNKSLK